ncbi:MAG: glycosyltransferase [Bacteroidota bacterium]|nr:glycosyltransferase [Bacteroidota bacterium]
MMAVLTIILCFLYLVLVDSYIFGWLRTKEFKVKEIRELPFLSIIIPARNEEENIENTIKDIANQDYPFEKFEVILLDDASTDDTLQIVENLQLQKGFSLSIIRLKEDADIKSHKKRAIKIGIEKSKGEWILTTDADCRRGKKWLSTVASFIKINNPYFISASVCFHEEKNFFEKMQSLEFISLIGIGAASIKNGMPNMCNGANLGFKKEIFYEVNGYEGFENIASGDDEFLMHKIAKKHPSKIKFLKNKNAIVYTKAKVGINDFFQQRKRWVSKSSKYKNISESIMIILVWLFHFLILSTGIIGIFNEKFLYLFVFSFAIKFFFEMIFVIILANYFGKLKYILTYLPASLLYVFYVVFIAFFANRGKYNWKGRDIKLN